jgi:hypothetical protein
LLASPGSLDGGIQGQDIGLEGDAVDDTDDPGAQRAEAIVGWIGAGIARAPKLRRF